MCFPCSHRCQLPLEDVVLSENPFSWNAHAHMLYVDSPAGAGLSYSDKQGEWECPCASVPSDKAGI